MLAMIRGKGMEPIVTLNHFTLPKWVLTPLISTFDNKEFQASLRGWENEVTVGAFVKFVQLVVPKFKDYVDYWVTLNEPTGVMGLGYLVGVFPPGLVLAGDRAKTVLFNLIDAHVRAYDAIKQTAGSSARVGFAHNMIFPKADTRLNLLGNNEAATAQFDYCFNRLFLEAVIDGIENRQISMNSQDARVRADWKGRLDFIGVNYYGPAYIFQDELVSIAASWAGGRYNSSLQGTTEQHGMLTEKGSEIYPGGLFRFLKYLDGRFHLPILITENGISTASDPIIVGNQTNEGTQAHRAPYIIAHLQQVLHAIKEGVNVIGYTYWTLVDTWEWSNKDSAKYGLFSIDRNSASAAASSPQPLPRTETQGAVALQYVILQGRLGDAPLRFGTISPSGAEEIHA
jgi:beta-glucosidase/6-phospho-beta-glucosidase/beta-galactosidase